MKFDLRGSDSIPEDLKKRMNHFLKKAKLRHSRVMGTEELEEFVEERLPSEIGGFYREKRKAIPFGWERSSAGGVGSKEKLLKVLKRSGFAPSQVQSRGDRTLTVSISYLPDRNEYFMVIKGQWKAPVQEGKKIKAEIVGPCQSQDQFQKMISGIDWN